ncbi:periplasmic heavy metal sensor [Pyruvatibacter mobilis]|uniref:periplasmic heavy metal sensor n=1 Tax=Pyruvatibacter mobilis TaxID=1712261 RepID=UPI003BABE33B
MTDQAPVSKPRRWVNIALFMSLAANLFFAGLLIGGPMLRDHPVRDRGVAVDMLPNPHMFIRILGKEEGRRVLRELRAEVPDLREKFRTMRQRHREVVAAMEADPYDPQALEQAFNNVRAAHTDLTTSLQVPLTRILAELTPDQRQRFSEAFRNLRGPGSPRNRPDGEGHPGGPRSEGPNAGPR